MAQERRSDQQKQKPELTTMFGASFIIFSVLMVVSQFLVYGLADIPRWVLACSAALFSVAFFLAQGTGNYQGIRNGAILFGMCCLQPSIFGLFPGATENGDMLAHLMMTMKTVMPYVPLFAGAMAVFHSACV